MEPQGELPLTKTPNQATIGEEVIFAQRCFSAALVLSITASGMDDKEVYMPLKIDGSHWTKIKKGEAYFPLDKLCEFMDLVGNEIPLQWLARARGKGLHMLQTEAERQLSLAESALAKEREKVSMLTDILKGKP